MSNTRSEILNAIGKTDDHNLKMVLLLMLSVMEEIGSKVDQIYNNKDQLKLSVLNGHADVHHSDHEWIKHQRIEDIQRRHIIDRLEPVLVWAETKIADEQDTKKIVKTNIAGMLTDAVKGILWITVGIGVAWLSHGTIVLPM